MSEQTRCMICGITSQEAHLEQIQIGSFRYWSDLWGQAQMECERCLNWKYDVLEAPEEAQASEEGASDE